VNRIGAHGYEAPFLAGRETGTTPTPQIGLLDKVGNVSGSHAEQCLAHGLIPVSLFVFLYGERRLSGSNIGGQRFFHINHMSGVDQIDIGNRLPVLNILLV
jgi:hypothetical protein